MNDNLKLLSSFTSSFMIMSWRKRDRKMTQRQDASQDQKGTRSLILLRLWRWTQTPKRRNIQRNGNKGVTEMSWVMWKYWFWKSPDYTVLFVKQFCQSIYQFCHPDPIVQGSLLLSLCFLTFMIFDVVCSIACHDSSSSRHSSMR